MSANNLKFVLLVFVLTALSFNHAFNFHLFFDDWIQIMGALYYPEVILRYAKVHPAIALEFKILSPFFQFNPYPWNFVGFLLKGIGALSMWPLMYALTDSKKVAFYSCLIFAVFVVGIESFVWASGSASAIIIPLISFGFYFWIKSARDKLDRNFFVGLFLFALSILAEPGRAFMVIVLASVWELLSLYQHSNLRKISISLSKTFLVFLLAPLAGFIISKFLGINPKPSAVIQQFLSILNYDPIDLLKNLLFGWTLLPEEYKELLTIIYFLVLISALFLFIFKKQNLYKNVIFLSLWISLFYIVNALANPLTGGSMESRYYALSAVGVIGFLAYGFSFIKTKYINELLALFLVFNLYVTNNILLHISTYRSVQIFDKVWNKIDQDVPQDEVGSVFMFTGAFAQRAAILDWNDTIPFSAKRKILAREKQPLFTNDKKLIAQLVCNRSITVLTPLTNAVTKEPIPLSHVHAWELKNGELENRSEQERDGIKKLAKCLQNIN